MSLYVLLSDNTHTHIRQILVSCVYIMCSCMNKLINILSDPPTELVRKKNAL